MKTTICNITGAAAIALAPLLATAQEPAVETVEVKTGEKQEEAKKPDTEAPVIQLAILLDTSSSMSGLIAQAKTQLWSIVNEFITAKQDGKTPVVQVALYEYGNNGLTAESNWIRQIQPLTRDLDKISEELFKLTTNGGKEYCGAVISEAAKSLKWDASSKIYKAIFIAGNEPFTQGPVQPKDACKQAITKGIIVNTIHCGNEQAGLSGGWKDGALLADGTFLTINQNQAVAHIDAPQDAAIVKLNAQLNDTYVVFGKEGERFKQNQIAQDSNARGIDRANLSRRAATKASANYYNDAWDIVDASQKKGFKWEDIKKEDLPEELKKMTTDELKAHVAKKRAEREDVKKKILALNKERDAYVTAKRKELGEDKSLGNAVSVAVRAQAASKGVSFQGGN